jgi:hypothetical protein
MRGKAGKKLTRKDCGIKEYAGDFSSINPHKQNVDIKMRNRGEH